MDMFLKYVAKATTTTHFPKKVHIVIGNESCDLDSTTSALVLAYFTQQNYKGREDILVLPVMNVSRLEFTLRRENCIVLKEIGIKAIDLYYKNTLKLPELVKKYDVKVTLVDHHVLSEEQEYLKPYVVRIFDHRPLDPAANWGDDVEIIMKPVGSCATLIAEEIFNKDPRFMTLCAGNILYDTIIFDTIGLSPTAGKTTDLDYSIAKRLEKVLCINHVNHKVLFDQLWAVHTDISDISPSQILLKDLKRVDNVLVPAVPMLVQNYLKLPEVINFLRQLLLDKDGVVVIMMGLEAKDDVERDLGFFAPPSHRKLLDCIIAEMRKIKWLDLREAESPIPEVICYKQNHVPSRKALLPYIKTILEGPDCNND